MLKNLNLPAQEHNFLNKTCGEIICQSETSFIIVCKICEMKIFQFNEFVEHFLLTHWPDTTESNKNDLNGYKAENIKTEYCAEDDREDVLYDEYNLDEPETIVVKIEYKNSVFDSNAKEDNDSSDMNEPLAILKKQLKEDLDYKCTTCNRSFNKKSYLEAHKQKHEGLQYRCNVCNRSFTKESLLKQHQRKHEELQFHCNECNRSFAKESLLKQHQYKHTGYPCEHCGKYYKQRNSLRYHMDTHKDEKNFICDFENCGKAFMNKRRLDAHKTVHSLKFVCEICGSRQSKHALLVDHMRTHTGEKPFVCSLCNHRFTSKNLLIEHKACHETERKHICNVCGKSFNRQKALYHHKHLHLGIKKFVCNVCGMAYAQAAGLSAHKRKHKENYS